MSETLICELCGKEGANLRLVDRCFGKGVDLLIIEHIPLVSCPNCHGRTLSAETLHEIEHIKLQRKNFAKERKIAVAVFTVDDRRRII